MIVFNFELLDEIQIVGFIDEEYENSILDIST